MNRVHRLVGPQGQRLTIVAGILGLESDAKLVEDEFRRETPGLVLMGVPYEDLDAIRATSGKELEAEFDSGDLDDVYLERLAQFGIVRSPPPDLYALYALADAAKVTVEAIDLGDEEYTESYTKHVGMLEVLRSNRSQKKLPERDFPSKTPEDFAVAWDAALFATKGLRRVQAHREEAMSDRLRALPLSPKPTFSLLSLPRVAGTISRLAQNGWIIR